jgi:hypothetical protein
MFLKSEEVYKKLFSQNNIDVLQIPIKNEKYFKSRLSSIIRLINEGNLLVELGSNLNEDKIENAVFLFRFSIFIIFESEFKQASPIPYFSRDLIKKELKVYCE